MHKQLKGLFAQGAALMPLAIALTVMTPSGAAAQDATAAPAADPAVTQDVAPQDVAADPAAASVDDASIVVTGSRVANGFKTPTPVTMASSEQLRVAAPTNLADGLNQLPKPLAVALPATISAIRQDTEVVASEIDQLERGFMSVEGKLSTLRAASTDFGQQVA